MEQVDYLKADRVVQWFIVEMSTLYPEILQRTIAKKPLDIEVIINGVKCSFAKFMDAKKNLLKIRDEEIVKKALELIDDTFQGLDDILYNCKVEIKRKLADRFNLDIEY